MAVWLAEHIPVLATVSVPLVAPAFEEWSNKARCQGTWPRFMVDRPLLIGSMHRDCETAACLHLPRRDEQIDLRRTGLHDRGTGEREWPTQAADIVPGAIQVGVANTGVARIVRCRTRLGHKRIAVQLGGGLTGGQDRNR